MVAGGAGAVRGLGVEQGADLAQGFVERGVGAAADRGGAGGRPVEAEDEPHGGGLSGAVGAEEAGDPAGQDAEGEVVHGARGAVLLGEVLDVDAGHGLSLAVGRGSGASPAGGDPSPPRGGGPLSVPAGTMAAWSASCARWPARSTYTRWLHLCVADRWSSACGCSSRCPTGRGCPRLLRSVPLGLIPAVRPGEGLQARLLLTPDERGRRGRTAISVAPSATWRDRWRTVLWLEARLLLGLRGVRGARVWLPVHAGRPGRRRRRARPPTRPC